MMMSPPRIRFQDEGHKFWRDYMRAYRQRVKDKLKENFDTTEKTEWKY
jgi:hypothetical protein